MNGELRRVSSVPGAFAELVLDTLALETLALETLAPDTLAPDTPAPDTPGGVRPPHPAECSLFLSGGPTAERCYRRLAACDPGADWSQVDVYMGDERCVPPDHPDSNHRMVAEVLLDPVGPVRSDHPMYRSGSPEEAASAYQRELEPLSRFDVVHLGMGPDGHCASLFPGSAALAEVDPTVLVMANRDPQADNPHDRITLTLPAIARARLVVFTVSGASKRPALEAVMSGEDLPAARVAAERVIWLADEEAAGPR